LIGQLAESIQEKTMNLVRNGVAAALFVILAVLAVNAETKAPSAKPYLGRWDVVLKDSAGKSYPTWLEISEPDGKIQVRMVARWGHARVLPKAELTDAGISFTSPKEEEGGKDTDMVFEGKLSGKTIAGTVNGPDGAKWTWTGKPAPSLTRKGAPLWGKPVTLFDGKDIAAWHPSDAAAKSVWKIENGTLISPGHGAELITNDKFEDFKLRIEFNRAKGSNSGVYLRGRYEVQIEDDPEPENETMRTGGVYGFLAPTPEVPRIPGTWQAYDITLVGRMVTVALDGKTIIDNQEIPGITGGALDSEESLPGPIYLQGSEEGHVAFRNIVVTPVLSTKK
jgi:hypothetical protein